MSLESKPIPERRPAFKFDGFFVDAGERRLTRNGEDISIAPKCFDALLLLLENAGRLVERGTLRARLWDANIVEESALARVIADLRKALGDTGSERQYLVTVPKFGYRFIAPVEHLLVEPPEIARHPTPPQEAALPAAEYKPLPRSGPPRTVARAVSIVIAAVVIVGGLALWLGWPKRQPVAARAHESFAAVGAGA